MDLAGINEIKNLHPDKCIKDEREMTRVILCFLKNCYVVFITIWSIESSTANSAANYSIMPFVVRVQYIFCFIIERIFGFRDELWSMEDKNAHDYYLEYRLT